MKAFFKQKDLGGSGFRGSGHSRQAEKMRDCLWRVEIMSLE
jgi:hypothetical protein